MFFHFRLKLDTGSFTTVIPFYKRNHKSTANPIYNFHGGLKGFLLTLVLIFCVEFRELSHLTRDLSQAEKNINAQRAIYFTENGRSCHFK